MFASGVLRTTDIQVVRCTGLGNKDTEKKFLRHKH